MSSTWEEYHPDWQYCFWTDEACLEFISENFPGLLQNYLDFPANIQRADLFRYLVLFKFGGVYVDMDFECFQNLESLLTGDVCTISIEPPAHCAMHKIPDLLCNAFLASIPEHPFIGLLIKESIKPLKPTPNKILDVLNSTGPYMVTRVYQQHRDKLELRIIDPKYVYPLSSEEVDVLLNDEMVPAELQTKLNEAVALHYWLNSWVT